VDTRSGNGVQKRSSRLLEDVPSCMGATHPIHTMLHTAAWRFTSPQHTPLAFLARVPLPQDLPCAHALVPAPGSTSTTARSEPAPATGCHVKTWGGAALDPNTWHVRLHSCSSAQDKLKVTSFDGSIETFACLALQPSA